MTQVRLVHLPFSATQIECRRRPLILRYEMVVFDAEMRHLLNSTAGLKTATGAAKPGMTDQVAVVFSSKSTSCASF